MNNENIKSEDMFPELDALQESGLINMFQAPQYLVENYEEEGFNKATARRVVSDWMKYKQTA